MRVLAIETSCDDTSLAIVEYKNETFEVTHMKAYSQIQQHAQYWWVVPELASREHAEHILEVFSHLVQEYLGTQTVSASSFVEFFEDIDNICYTAYPGLPWSLIVGKTFARMLSHTYDIPHTPVNHIYGHIFSIYADRHKDTVQFPAAVLTVSGGHNELYLLEQNNTLTLTKLGESVDDAAWECFDKVSRMLGWPYPWWPRISQQATLWKPNPNIKLQATFLDSYKHDFSFSGLKSQVHHILQDLTANDQSLTPEYIADICFAFQETVTDVLAKKLIRAWIIHDVKSLAIVWWVSANDRLREKLQSLTQNIQWLTNQANKYEKDHTKDYAMHIHRPIKKIYSTDNGGMIGVVWCIQLWCEQSLAFEL